MNEIIAKLVTALISFPETKEATVALTLNYEHQIGHDYGQPVKFDDNGVWQIRESLMLNKVDNFNLTLEFTNRDVYDKDGSFNEIYEPDWYRCQLIFHGGDGKLCVAFDMLCSYAHFSDSDFKGYFDRSKKRMPIGHALTDTEVNIDLLPNMIASLIGLKDRLIGNNRVMIAKLKEIKRYML